MNTSTQYSTKGQSSFSDITLKRLLPLPHTRLRIDSTRLHMIAIKSSVRTSANRLDALQCFGSRISIHKLLLYWTLSPFLALRVKFKTSSSTCDLSTLSTHRFFSTKAKQNRNYTQSPIKALGRFEYKPEHLFHTDPTTPNLLTSVIPIHSNTRCGNAQE